MPSTQLPKLGLYKGWSLNEKGWDQEMNANLCKLDAMVAVGVTGQVATADLPVAGNQGEQFLLVDTNEIATFQGGAWLKCPIPKGLPILDCASGTMYTFDGASVIPMEVNIPEAAVADVLAGVPDLFVTSEVLCNSLNDIFGAGVITGAVAPTAAPGPKELPIYCDTVTSLVYVWDGAAWVSKEAAEPPFTITYDEAGAGSASADLFVKTTADGCIDDNLVKGFPEYATTTAYETAIGGAGNLTGGERMYDPVTGVPLYYNAITASWEPMVSEPIKKAYYLANGGGAQTFNSNVTQAVLWNNTIYTDFPGAMDAAGAFTVPAGCDGCYMVEWNVGLNIATSIDFQTGTNSNLVLNTLDYQASSAGYWLEHGTANVTRTHIWSMPGVAILDLAVGDVLEVTAYQVNTPSGATFSLLGTEKYTNFRIIYLGRR